MAEKTDSPKDRSKTKSRAPRKSASRPAGRPRNNVKKGDNESQRAIEARNGAAMQDDAENDVQQEEIRHTDDPVVRNFIEGRPSDPDRLLPATF